MTPAQASAISAPAVAELLTGLRPSVLAAVLPVAGRWSAAIRQTERACAAASVAWPTDGLPDRPDAWLRARAADQLPGPVPAAPGQAAVATVLLALGDPWLGLQDRADLVGYAAGGLGAADLAAASGSDDGVVRRRLRRNIATAATPEEPGDARLAGVLAAIGLLYDDGHWATDAVVGGRLCAGAIGVARALAGGRLDDPEVVGLLSLLLLREARRESSRDAVGRPLALRDQDRGRWRWTLIAEGTHLLLTGPRRRPFGPWQVRACIAAVVAESSDDERTDWAQLVALSGSLELCDPGSAARLGQVRAAARVDVDLARSLLEPLVSGSAMSEDPAVHALHAQVLDLAGDHDAARRARHRHRAVGRRRAAEDAARARG